MIVQSVNLIPFAKSLVFRPGIGICGMFPRLYLYYLEIFSEGVTIGVLSEV
jgi:hypothetical protein